MNQKVLTLWGGFQLFLWSNHLYIFGFLDNPQYSYNAFLSFLNWFSVSFNKKDCNSMGSSNKLFGREKKVLWKKAK